MSRFKSSLTAEIHSFLDAAFRDAGRLESQMTGHFLYYTYQ